HRAARGFQGAAGQLGAQESRQSAHGRRKPPSRDETQKRLDCLGHFKLGYQRSVHGAVGKGGAILTSQRKGSKRRLSVSAAEAVETLWWLTQIQVIQEGRCLDVVMEVFGEYCCARLSVRHAHTEQKDGWSAVPDASDSTKENEEREVVRSWGLSWSPFGSTKISANGTPRKLETSLPYSSIMTAVRWTAFRLS
ncbi:hypothetical protein KCU64_g1, partial [Aureobasidium melanogenum]